MELETKTRNFSIGLECEDGIFLPPWAPLEDVSDGDIALRGIIYIVFLAYLFVGIAYLCDKFMDSIQVIASKRKEIKVQDENGNESTVVVQVWNETVANLTLMVI